MADALGTGLDGHRFLPKVTGALGRGDDHRHGAIGFLAAIEQVQRFADPARGLVFFQGDRLAVEKRLGVGRGKIPRRHCDPTEVFAGSAIGVHVALGEHPDPGRRCMEAVGHVPAVVDVVEGRCRSEAVAAGTEAIPGTLVHGPIHHHHFCHPSGHGHRRVHHRSAGRTAAMGHLREKLDVLAPQQSGDFILRDLVHRVGAEALDLGRIDAGVLERAQGGLQGQAQFGASGVLGKFGCA
ncbi:hypothetical protein D3C87_1274240 [compost metagenome]